MAKQLASEAQRTAEYNIELFRRYRTGQFLTATDKRDARKLEQQSSIECPHCHFGFFPTAILQHIAEKH